MKQAFGIDIPHTLEDVCTPNRLALLVYDMQVGIKSQVKEGDTIVAKTQEILKAARAAHVRVFFTRHMSLPKELMGAFQFRMAMTWQRVDDPEKVVPWFLRDTPGFAIVPELQPLPSEAHFAVPNLWRSTSPISILRAAAQLNLLCHFEISTKCVGHLHLSRCPTLRFEYRR